VWFPRRMSARDIRSAARADVTAVGLLTLSLALLYAGRFVQFDDTSGGGSDEWVMPLGLLAGLVAAMSVRVALADAAARRLLGAAMVVVDASLIWQAATNDGFRFIWASDEGELFIFQVLLALTGLILTATAVRRPVSGRMTDVAGGRVVAYLGAAVLISITAFFVGTAHFDRTNCSGPDFDGECDLAPLEGLMWAAAAIVLVIVTAVVLEVVRLRRRRSPV
jgi:hypothetical protein